MTTPIPYPIALILTILEQYLVVVFLLGILVILIIKYLLNKPSTSILYFSKQQLEMFPAKETTDAVYGTSHRKNELLVFLKRQHVAPSTLKMSGKTHTIWVCIEGYKYVVDMNHLQDLIKTPINEEFLSLYRKKSLSHIIGEVIKGNLKTSIALVVGSICVGILIGFFVVPLWLRFLGFV